MYRRFKFILLVLLSILTIQFALPLILSWTSDVSSNVTEEVTSPGSSKEIIAKKASNSQTKIDLSHLPFRPSCVIRTKNAASAIERAKSIKCKEELVNVTCMIQKNQLYPRQLLTNCPHKGKRIGSMIYEGEYFKN